MTMKSVQQVQKTSSHKIIEIRETGFYKQEYSKGFVSKWDELIDWERRQAGEGAFFVEELKKREVSDVLDVATGTGFHSISLLRAGFRVVSADGNPNMLGQASMNAKKLGCKMQPVNADWRFLSSEIEERYDAVICLGNSFTHLFCEKDRRRALAEYYSLLRPNGILVIDQRNYDSILDNGFTSKHKYYYCGKHVVAEPIYIDEGLTRFRYLFDDKSEYYLNMFPLRKKYLQRLIVESGFQNIETFGDFKKEYNNQECDFFIHVVDKGYRN